MGQSKRFFRYGPQLQGSEDFEIIAALTIPELDLEGADKKILVDPIQVGKSDV